MRWRNQNAIRHCLWNEKTLFCCVIKFSSLRILLVSIELHFVTPQPTSSRLFLQIWFLHSALLILMRCFSNLPNSFDIVSCLKSKFFPRNYFPKPESRSCCRQISLQNLQQEQKFSSKSKEQTRTSADEAKSFRSQFIKFMYKFLLQSKQNLCRFMLIFNFLFTQGDSPFGKSEAYVKLEQLGEGSYATVFKGFSKWVNLFHSMFRPHKSPLSRVKTNKLRRKLLQFSGSSPAASRRKFPRVIVCSWAMWCMLRGDIKFQIFYEAKLDSCLGVRERESRSTGSSIEFYPLVALKHQEFAI